MQASKLNPKAPLPLLGLAQMNLLQKENTNAITLLENALQLHPGWNDALMVQLLYTQNTMVSNKLDFQISPKFQGHSLGNLRTQSASPVTSRSQGKLHVYFQHLWVPRYEF